MTTERIEEVGKGEVTCLQHLECEKSNAREVVE